MKTRIALMISVVLSACTEDESVIRGSLLAEDAEGWVWVEGSPDRSAISDSGFELQQVRGDTIDLHFAVGEREPGRMRILGLRGGSTLTLERVWVEDGWAFPTRIALEGSPAVEINRLRLAGPDRLRGAIETDATLLARDGEAVLLRPTDPDMPDLRVVLTQATSIRGVDGEPASLSDAEFGDSLSVAGEMRGDFLIAAQIVLPRSATLGLEASGGERIETVDDRDRDDRDDSGDERARREEDEDREPRARRGPPALGRSIGRGRGRGPDR